MCELSEDGEVVLRGKKNYLRTEIPRVDSWYRHRFFFKAARLKRLWGPPSLLRQGTRSFCAGSIKVTNHFLQVSRSTLYRQLISVPPWRTHGQLLQYEFKSEPTQGFAVFLRT